MFASPPPGVEWPQGAGPTTQTSVEIEDEDVDWAVLGAGEEAAAGYPQTAEEEISNHPAHRGGAKYQ